MAIMTTLWTELRQLLSGAVPLLAQVALLYLILRFAVAVARTITQLAAVPRPKTAPVNVAPEGAAPAEGTAALPAAAPAQAAGQVQRLPEAPASGAPGSGQP